VRVATVMVSAFAAAILGFWAYAQQSVVIGAAAFLCVVITFLALVGPRRSSRSAEAAHPTLPDLAAYSSTGASVMVDQVALNSETPAPDPIASPAATPVAEPELAPLETPAAAPSPEPVAGSAAPESPARALTRSPAVRTPFSVQPTVVLMSLFDAASARYDTLAAHLWLEDPSSETLRLIAAFGPRVPEISLVSVNDAVLGRAATSGSTAFAPLGIKAVHNPAADLWRYAVPVGTPEMLGVAAVDIAATEEAPSAGVLNEIAAVLRGSLTAAVAIHVAHAEMETAVQLLQAAQELASGMGKDDVISAALHRAMSVAGASTGSVMLPDPVTGELRIVAAKGLPDDVVKRTSLSRGQGIAGVVYESGTATLVEDLPGNGSSARHGVRSSAVVPISDGEGNLGVLNVGSREFPSRLTDMYLRALGILASQTALAIRATEAVERSWDTYLENLQAFATAMEANDPFLAGSSKRIADLSVAVAHAMGMHPDEIVSLRIAAILHDVGMGLATGSVGSADRPLSTIDRGLVRAHPKVAADVMSTVPSLERLAPIVRHHHERYDGTGYDTGLSGDSIPLGSRILAVVDAYVSMTSPRAYRAALTWEDALNELQLRAGSQFDPAVVRAFQEVVHDRADLALQVVPENHS